MSDRPNAEELLAEARRILREDIAPQLSGDTRFKVLMVANAVGIAERELKAAPLINETGVALEAVRTLRGKSTKAAIRDGDLDAQAPLHAAMVDHTLARLRVSNPKAAQGD